MSSLKDRCSYATCFRYSTYWNNYSIFLNYLYLSHWTLIFFTKSLPKMIYSILRTHIQIYQFSEPFAGGECQCISFIKPYPSSVCLCNLTHKTGLKSFMILLISLAAWIVSVGKILTLLIFYSIHSHEYFWTLEYFNKPFDFYCCFLKKNIFVMLQFFHSQPDVLYFWFIVIITWKFSWFFFSSSFMNLSTNTGILVTLANLLLFQSNK